MNARREAKREEKARAVALFRALPRGPYGRIRRGELVQLARRLGRHPTVIREWATLAGPGPAAAPGGGA